MSRKPRLTEESILDAIIDHGVENRGAAAFGTDIAERLGNGISRSEVDTFIKTHSMRLTVTREINRATSPTIDRYSLRYAVPISVLMEKVGHLKGGSRAEDQSHKPRLPSRPTDGAEGAGTKTRGYLLFLTEYPDEQHAYFIPGDETDMIEALRAVDSNEGDTRVLTQFREWENANFKEPWFRSWKTQTRCEMLWPFNGYDILATFHQWNC